MIVDEISSCSGDGVRNSQPEGIGRVAALPGLVAWNNLGRNVVFADTSFTPLAVFGDTDHPDDDELSQYDLDVHAILPLHGTGLVAVLNHLGTLRAFDAPALTRPGRVTPAFTTTFAADVERAVAAGGHLVGSRPRTEGRGGVLVSEAVTGGRAGRPLALDAALEDLGEVTALAAFDVGADVFVAAAGPGRVALAPFAHGGIGRPRWIVDVDHRPAALVHDGARLWSAGSELTSGAIDDYRWEDLRGGAFAALDVTDGRTVLRGALPDDVAWGNGGVAVVVVDHELCALGRTGRVHVVSSDVPPSRPLASASLGIAHAATVGARVLFGFNRGGYRLFAATP